MDYYEDLLYITKDTQNNRSILEDMESIVVLYMIAFIKVLDV